MPKKILVTGGVGFIGSYLAQILLEQGEEVFVIDNLSTGSRDNIKHLEDNQNFHFIEGSVLDKNLMSETMAEVEQVYHLAAAVGVKTVMEKPLESFLNNIKGTEVVLDLACKNKLPVLFTSSSEVYGKNDGLPFKEDSDRVYGSAYNDRWGYALSKGSDEFLSLAYFREKSLPVVIVRLFNVIGPRQTGFYGMVVPTFVKQALEGKSITVFGDGEQSRCFADIEDVTQALIDLMNHTEARGQIFNLGSEEEISIKELAQKIKTLTQSNSTINFIPYAEAYSSGFEDMAHRKPDLAKIKQTIEYQPKNSLEESLKKIIEYFHVR